MKVLLLWAAALGLMAQKLETQKPDPTKVVRVETAKDHLTVIELSEVVTMVAIGNRDAFTIERRENKVFVTPADEAARTNLFIWTSGGRYAYELVPAKDVDEMHFAIDQLAAPVTASAAAKVEDEAVDVGLPVEMLTKAVPVMVAGERETNGRVEVSIRDLYRKDNRLFLRYAVANNTQIGYQPSRPAAWSLEGARAHQSLISLAGRQLGEQFARSLKAESETSVEVLTADQCETVPAGGQGLGWLVLDDPQPTSTDDVSVLRLQFAADAKGAVTAVLVLRNANAQEVARVKPAAQ